MNIIHKILELTIQNPKRISMEHRDGVVTITGNKYKWDIYDHIEFEIKRFSDEKPLEYDGNLNAGLSYAYCLLGFTEPENEFKGMDLNEIYHLSNNAV